MRHVRCMRRSQNQLKPLTRQRALLLSMNSLLQSRLARRTPTHKPRAQSQASFRARQSDTILPNEPSFSLCLSASYSFSPGHRLLPSIINGDLNSAQDMHEFVRFPTTYVFLRKRLVTILHREQTHKARMGGRSHIIWLQMSYHLYVEGTFEEKALGVSLRPFWQIAQNLSMAAIG